MSQQNPRSQYDFINGMILVLVLHAAFSAFWYIFCHFASNVFRLPGVSSGYESLTLLLTPFIFIGVTQLVYVLPAYVYCFKQGRSEVCKGVAVGGLLTLMVNGSCFGFLNIMGMGTMPVGVVAIAFTIGIIGLLWVMWGGDRR